LREILASRTFRQSPRLTRLLHYLCSKATGGEADTVSEYTIAVDVFDKPAGFKESKDAIVRVEMHRLRRQLARYYAEEGSAHGVKVVVPVGKYAPEFQVQEPAAAPEDSSAIELSPGMPLTSTALESLPALPPAPVAVWSQRSRWPAVAAGGVVLVAAVLIVWGYMQATRARTQAVAVGGAVARQADAAGMPANGEIRILAGSTGGSYTDAAGHVWQSDRYYRGGTVKPGPKAFIPPPPDRRLFETMREGESDSLDSSDEQRLFRYDIPMAGTHELRLHFADPLNDGTGLLKAQDSQDLRRFSVRANGQPLLPVFDPITDAGFAAFDVRAFRNIVPAEDGKLHLEFLPDPNRPFINAIELVPSELGRANPIRIGMRNSPWTDPDGKTWEPDTYFIRGRRIRHSIPQDTLLAELYREERYGHFSYAVPVPPGTYTVNLHFAETFFFPFAAMTGCRGPGCRVFDVTCNGEVLLRDLDVFQAAGGAFRPLVRTFRGLQPNGQGKLLLSFSPSVNYAEVRAIEVLDEAK
jgi:hypothetical protein